jgi:biopolymer transport protein ExbB/TolQ
MLIEKLLKVALLGSSWVLVLLLVLSVWSISTMVERAWFFWRRRGDVEELTERLLSAIGHRRPEEAVALLKASRTVEASVVAPALRYVDATPDAVSDAIEAELVRMRQEMDRGTTLLGTLGNNAPFIGLFGTVIGVVIAFHQLGVNQASAAMGAVMSGIAEALVATAVGLFVAIPAVVAYNVIQKRITDIEANVGAISKHLTALLKALAAGYRPNEHNEVSSVVPLRSDVAPGSLKLADEARS